MTRHGSKNHMGPVWHGVLWIVSAWIGNRAGDAIDREVGGKLGAFLGFVGGTALSWLIENLD